MHPVKQENPICRGDGPLHTKRAEHAAHAYNELHQILSEWGWTEKMGSRRSSSPTASPKASGRTPKLRGRIR